MAGAVRNKRRQTARKRAQGAAQKAEQTERSIWWSLHGNAAPLPRNSGAAVMWAGADHRRAPAPINGTVNF